jgi:hypothetical protein
MCDVTQVLGETVQQMDMLDKAVQYEMFHCAVLVWLENYHENRRVDSANEIATPRTASGKRFCIADRGRYFVNRNSRAASWCEKGSIEGNFCIALRQENAFPRLENPMRLEKMMKYQFVG